MGGRVRGRGSARDERSRHQTGYGARRPDARGNFAFGLVFGYATKKTGSLWPACVLHALNDLLASALVVG